MRSKALILASRIILLYGLVRKSSPTSRQRAKADASVNEVKKIMGTSSSPAAFRISTAAL